MDNHQLASVLLEMEGHWISQRTTYCLKNNKIQSAQVKTQVSLIKTNKMNVENNNRNQTISLCEYYPLLNREVFYVYKPSKIRSLTIQGTIQKYYNNKLETQFFLLQNNYLKININKKNIHYLEYVYFISSKLRISVTFIKLHEDYVAIAFNSHIKINRRD